MKVVNHAIYFTDFFNARASVMRFRIHTCDWSDPVHGTFQWNVLRLPEELKPNKRNWHGQWKNDGDNILLELDNEIWDTYRGEIGLTCQEFEKESGRQVKIALTGYSR